ncbi:MAG: SagB/ThcOx family dehydrogenase [Actinomycetota bacterium]|nr:SagB/ThcOx family dehydrogenase [Actinomycetota bacterium]
MRTRQLLVGLLTFSLVAGGCGETEEPETQVEALETIDLPLPNLAGEMSLEEALTSRRSTREFTDEPLTMAELSQLFWAAQGETRPGRRTNPSAGALYPIEVYAVTKDGVYHYLPDGHRVELLSTDDLRDRLFWASWRQEAVRDAPAVFVICGVFSRTEAKYGGRAERYVKLEAGHIAQSLLLQAVALDLGGVPMGAFLDSQVQSSLDLPDDHEPLYLIPIGHPG